ncbi:MAG: 23S rRNA (pseudouridine(1915)-N(3))-methyltransferase RlmH [Bacteroidia bacterium]|nr:MAG: 23S rRNA (pseudouridine(1915)-N(3))-methyltransferase RlmH [Bacteroidia bacterium]
MRITLIESGKTRDSFIKEGVELFRLRVVRYVPFKIETLPELKKTRNLTMKEVQNQEGVLLLKWVKPTDHLVLLDERGQEYNSISFAEYLNSLEGRVNHLVFVIGGPYGFSEEVYKRADAQLSLSKLTFSHQLVRVIFMEQLYRAYTILKGEPYHHA